MNELLIRVTGSLYHSSEVIVNGQKEKLVSNGHGSYELSVAADEQNEIQIVRNHELLSPAWLLWGLFFFVISCFGIFDVPYAKTPSLCCRVNVNGGGVVQFSPCPKKDGKAAKIECSDCVVDELENSSKTELVKKRLKKLRIIKLFMWLALIATVIAIVIL